MCPRLQPRAPQAAAPSHVSRYSGESADELGPKLLEELQLVRNAFFCSPEDQSAWFYHRWLLAQLAQHSSAAVAPEAVLLDELGAVEELLARPRGQSRRAGRRQNKGWPPAARGALALACGGPLGFGAELGPLGPRGAALGPLRLAAKDADFAAPHHSGARA